MDTNICTLTNLADKLNMLVTKHHSIILENTQLSYHLREAEAKRIETLASFSHEMKKPLSVLRSLLWQLECDVKKMKHIEMAHKMNEEITRATSLLDNIITLNKLELKKISRPVNIHLSHACHTECDRYQLRFPQHEWIAIIEEDIHLTVAPELIFAIIENLFENAAKYTPGSGTINVDLRTKNRRIILTVTDSGVGMTAEEQRRILMPFQRGDTSVTGSGLGLTILSRAIDDLDGELHIESEKGAGSSFVITIPLS